LGHLFVRCETNEVSAKAIGLTTARTGLRDDDEITCREPRRAASEAEALHDMSKVASVTFAFDGTEKEFARLYRAIADIDLDIAAYSKGTTGVIEFMIGDLAAFKEQVAKKSAELGVDLIVLDCLASERNVQPRTGANRSGPW